MAAQKKGVLVALIAYVIWGVFPMFWKQLGAVSSIEVLLSRVIWAFVFTALFLLVIGQGKVLLTDLKGLAKHKGQLVRLFFASIFISINWGVFIWAVNAGQILQSSLGYYINPLILVLFGVIFFKERLERYTLVAILIAAVGVLILTISYGQVPWIALTLALTFAIYGVLKKKITLDATRGLAIETLFITPFAIVGYMYLKAKTEVSFVNEGLGIS
ncbi:MAG: EamA family transporter RarD, partial [Lysinibacillus sp.]